MLKYGRISSIDAAAGRYKVTFDEDKLPSGWLHAAVPNSKDNKDELPFAMDEHVACMMSHDLCYGIVMCAVYDKKNAPPIGDPAVRGTTYKNGSFSKVNTDTGEVEVDFEKITINGGNNGGIPKAEDVASKISALENQINSILNTLISTVIPLAPSGTYPFASLYASMSPIAPITQKSDLENTDILH